MSETPEPTNESTEPIWETGDWDYDPKTDPKWDDPKTKRRRVPVSEYPRLADVIVRGEAVEFCIIEDLRALIEAVQAHPDALLHRISEPDKDGFIRSEGVFDQSGKKIGDGQRVTQIKIYGCLIETAEVSGLDITCTLMCRSRFGGHAAFSRARFGGLALFSRARFDGGAGFYDARFGGYGVFKGARFDAETRFLDVRFSGNAEFDRARFGGNARFDGAQFGGHARFDGARFGGHARFGEARFSGNTRFGKARFGGSAGFYDARFGGLARFDEARFGGHARFDDTRFAGDAGFDEARFGEGAWFDGTVFLTGAFFARAIIKAHADFSGDVRHIDARAIVLESVYPTANTNQPHHIRNRLRAWARVLWRRLKTQRVPWTSVRAISEFSILSRISVLALILVPPIASAWPAIRTGIVGYNESVEDAARRFVDASESLRDAAAGLEDHERVGELVSGVEQSIGAWSDRFGRMTIDSQDLPMSLAITFFAAALVTGGRLMYQMRAPDRIKQHSEEDFIEWMHTRYDDEAPDRDDGLRRACESLRAIANQLPERHANFVQHHEETIWIPPKEHIEWFTDLELPPPEPDSEDSETQDLDSAVADEITQPEKSNPPRYPDGYLPAAERARIAIEEGAKAEYLLRSRENPISALICFIMYASAMVLLIWILAIQGLSVLRASGLIASEHTQTTKTVETRTPSPA